MDFVNYHSLQNNWQAFGNFLPVHFLKSISLGPAELKYVESPRIARVFVLPLIHDSLKELVWNNLREH